MSDLAPPIAEPGTPELVYADVIHTEAYDLSELIPGKVDFQLMRTGRQDLIALRCVGLFFKSPKRLGGELFNLPDTKVVMKIKPVEKSKAVRRKLRELGFNYTEAVGRHQADAYLTSGLSIYDRLNISRGIQSSSTADCFPFVTCIPISYDAKNHF